MRRLFLLGFWIFLPATSKATDPVAEALSRPIIGPRQTLAEVQDFCEVRLPRMPEVKTADEWTRQADRYRAEVLDKVISRGKAREWRSIPTKSELQETIDGGAEYRIKKMRIEVVPNLWIPALLYEPKTISGKAPVVLNLSGHDPKGMATPDKQIRCINLAKRGILAMSLEWFGMGQLKGPGFAHDLINTINLTGTSGISLHYLAQTRAIDVLLAHPRADPKRVGVTGLSGGGWQTIFVSSLDPRVTLTDPVAGYSGFATRIHYFSDLGDSEQTPCDLATVADYTHLTAMMAPRPTLLTFNGKDNCCFAAPHSLPPLMDAASPIFKLFDAEKNLRTHINLDPGDHNYGLDNRLALYQMIADHWSTPELAFKPGELPTEGEIKTAEALNVALPEGNLNFRTLAGSLAFRIPDPPSPGLHGEAWRARERPKLRAIVHPFEQKAEAEKVDESESGGLRVVSWRVRLGNSWTVPAVEMSRANAKKTAILVADSGRKSAVARAKSLLESGFRVLAVDPFYFGEAQIPDHAYLFALLVEAVGERPLGIQAGQLLSIARWRAEVDGSAPIVVAEGPRTGTIATVAAALDESAIAGLELHSPLESLKELLSESHAYTKSPELYCFGLLNAFDIWHIREMVEPRPVKVKGS